MNFTFLPSSSVLIHSSSRIFVACTFKVLKTAATYSVFGLAPLRCLTQTWAANSLSRWASYISSSDPPTSALAGLNIHLHSEPTEALKVLVLNPYQLAWHGRSIRPKPCVKQNSVQRLAHA